MADASPGSLLPAKHSSLPRLPKQDSRFPVWSEPKKTSVTPFWRV